MLEKLERLANALSDADWTWWPFLFLRPRRRDPMDTRRVFQIGICFGPMFALALLLGREDLRRYTDVRIGFLGIAIATISAFSLYRMTFAVLWNRRAARLRALYPERFDC